MTSYHLRTIAAITMLIDHIGLHLYNDWLPFRIIGRTAFPIFAFLLVVGYYHTQDQHKYLKRLAIFALISQIPFSLLNNFTYELNVMVTLLLGIICLHLINQYRSPSNQFLIIISTAGVAYLLQSDYDFWGIITIVLFHFAYHRQKQLRLPLLLLLFVGYLLALLILQASTEGIHSWKDILFVFHLLALIPLWFFNGEKGPASGRFFYWFYPVHLLLIYLIQVSIQT